jgi:hypothetical protein
MAQEPQNKDDQNGFKFSHEIQTSVLAMLLFDEKKLAEVSNFIKPKYFKNEVLQSFASIILNHFQKYRRNPSQDEFLEELGVMLTKDSKKALIEDEYWNQAKDVLAKEAEDFNYVWDKLLKFVKYAEMERAILDSIEIVRKDKDYNEIVAKVQAAAAIGELKDSRLEVVSFAEGEPKIVDWLWSGRIPKNKLTLIVGDPGVGKSWFTLWLAAQVTQGKLLPGTPAGTAERGKIIHLSAEDDLDDTILPRFLASGGDPNAAHLIQGIKNESRMFDLDRDLNELGKVLEKEGDVKLIVIDPVSAYIGRSVDTHKEKDVRSLLTPVANFAKKHNVAVVGIVHLNKSADLGAIYRVSGSMAFVAAARAVWLVGEDRDDPDLRHFNPIKINNARKRDKEMGFRILDSMGLVVTEPQTSTSADDLLAPRERKDPKQRAAEAFLEEMFKDRKEVPAAEAIERAEEEGISKSTLRLARKALRILTKQTEGGWLWIVCTGSQT